MVSVLGVRCPVCLKNLGRNQRTEGYKISGVIRFERVVEEAQGVITAPVMQRKADTAEDYEALADALFETVCCIHCFSLFKEHVLNAVNGRNYPGKN